MQTFHRYSRPAPRGSIVVRIVSGGDGLFGFIREVDEDDADETYPTEQKPIEDVWRLVENRLKGKPDARVLVELEAGVEWQPQWGELVA